MEKYSNNQLPPRLTQHKRVCLDENQGLCLIALTQIFILQKLLLCLKPLYEIRLGEFTKNLKVKKVYCESGDDQNA